MSERLGLLSRMREEGFEDIVFMSDPAISLLGVIAIHDTTLGPAFGGSGSCPTSPRRMPSMTRCGSRRP